MILVIDTETSGLLNSSLSLSHPSQPHIVQLAAWLGDFDRGGDCLCIFSFNAIIRPDGWTISSGAEAVHGISQERAKAVGEPLAEVLHHFYDIVSKAATESTTQLVAHNLRFDHQMLLRDSAGFDSSTLGLLQPFCTMIALTPRMRLPGRYPGKYKWPKLEEAHQFCFGTPSPSADRHTAMGDVLVCRDIFLHGRREGWWR